LLISAVLITVLTLVYQVENLRGRRAFASASRDFVAAGFSLDLRSYLPPAVPDELNLAKIPLLNPSPEPATQDQRWSTVSAQFEPADTKAPGKRFSHFFRGNFPVSISPRFETQTQAQADQLRSEMALLAEHHDQEDLLAFLARVSPLIDQLGEAAALRPHFFVRSDLDRPTSEIRFPEFSFVQSFRQATVLQAIMALEAGRPAEASRAISLLLRFQSTLRSSPWLIVQVHADGLRDSASSLIWQGMIHQAWNVAELDTFAALLADDRVLGSYRQSLAAETLLSARMIQQKETVLPAQEDQVRSQYDAHRHFLRLIDYFPSGWLHQNAAFCFHTFLDQLLPQIDATNNRVHRTTPPANELSPGFSRVTATGATATPYTFFAQLVGIRGGFHSYAGYSKTNHDITRIAVALEKHRLLHGAYPASLAPVLAADPALAALHDPFDGQPYRYRRDADGGFTLWGIGPDLKDDGGTPTKLDASGVRQRPFDLVWRIPGP
jgi:hypothetical protein